MKKIFTFLAAMVLGISVMAQLFETDILPDSLFIKSGREFCASGDTVHILAYSDSYYNGPFYYLKIEGDNYEFVNNVPYEMGFSRLYGFESYNGNYYHLTKYNGVQIYKEDGSWDSLTVDNGIHSGWTQGLFIDGDKMYVISQDTLNYFDGSVWSYYYLNTDNEYVKTIKYDDKIYFNINENTSSSTGGIYVFDGTNLELLIDKNFIYDFEIVNNQIYLLDSYSEATYYDLVGELVNLSFEYPMSTIKSVVSHRNDSLYLLSEEKAYLIRNNEIIQIQHGLSREYDDCKKISSYNSGFLTKSKDNKLIYINPNMYESFGTIQLGKTYKNLDINRVDAYYMNRGQMFWDGESEPKYEVPKGLGKVSLFASGLWITGFDEMDILHVAVSKFNSDGAYDYSPGPLKASGVNKGTTDTLYARNFDYIWKITKEEILLHQLFYNSPDYVMPEDIASWPAHGDVSQGYAEDLAPFIDINNNGVYEPEQGDYPDIKGDMSLYWIYNDNLSVHTESEGSLPFGVEVHAQAYAFYCDTLTDDDTGINYTAESTIINYTTFLDYKIINRSENNYDEVNIAFWTDADIGDPFDDYAGCNVELNSSYLCNGDENDGDGTGKSYGINPPVQFLTVLDAPLAEENDGVDNDNDGTIDEVGEKSLMNRVINFDNNNGNTGDPEIPLDYHKYMTGLWKDDRHVVFGGTGYSPSDNGIYAKYMFSGNTDPWFNGTSGIDPNYTIPGGWTEENEFNSPGDRRALISTGPFEMISGNELNYTMAFIFTRGYSNVNSDIEKGFVEVAKIIELYNNDELAGCGLETVSVNEMSQKQNIEVFPNPVAESFVINGVGRGVYYQIIDVKGELVIEGVLDSKEINVKDLTSGVYFLKILSDKQTETVKLIKM